MATYGVRLERSAPLELPRHPDAPADDRFLQWCADEKASGRALAVDLFSGAGGLGAGVESAGWTVVAAVDNDKTALETHRANFRGQALEVDMSDHAQVTRLVEHLRPVGIDLVAGGPPCQPFSRAGRAKIRSLINEGARDAVDARKELWRSFIFVVLALRPRAVLMENVPDMAIGDDLAVIREIARTLEHAGYMVDYRLLDAWKHGVPQHRKRFILQARNDGAVPRWPVANAGRPSVRDAIEDLPRLSGTTGARELPYLGEPKRALAKELRGGANSEVIYDHMTRPVRADDYEAFELMTPSTLYADLPERLRRYRSDTFNDKYKRLAWDDLSRTITAHIAKDGYWYIHPSEHRTLTVREAARIQTFADDFRFCGTRSDAFRQIGNAVPPMLGRSVAASIRPLAARAVETSPLQGLRAGLEDWALARRSTAWWLFPGPEMTRVAALIAAMLEVHRLPEESARGLMEPLRGAEELTDATIQHIDGTLLSAGRRQLLRRLRVALRGDLEGHSARERSTEFAQGLGEAQVRSFTLLCGEDALLVNQHVAKIVSLLMGLPRSHAGLRTDIKVALAQLVSTDPSGPLRMCAIRTMSLSDARIVLSRGDIIAS